MTCALVRQESLLSSRLVETWMTVSLLTLLCQAGKSIFLFSTWKQISSSRFRLKNVTFSVYPSLPGSQMYLLLPLHDHCILVNLSSSPSILQSIHPSFSPSIHPSIYPSLCAPIHPSIPSSTYSSFYPYLAIHSLAVMHRS